MRDSYLKRLLSCHLGLGEQRMRDLHDQILRLYLPGGLGRQLNLIFLTSSSGQEGMEALCELLDGLLSQCSF
jgi:hypothetical protein